MIIRNYYESAWKANLIQPNGFSLSSDEGQRLGSDLVYTNIHPLVETQLAIRI